MARIACSLVALALLGAGCANDPGAGNDSGQPAASQQPPEVAIAVAEQGVTDIPQDVSAGIVTISITNEGDKKLAPALALIDEGVEREKVGIALTTQDFQTFFTSAVVAGAVFSPGEIDLLPGTTGTLTTELPEGTYIVADPESKGFEPGYLEVGPASGNEATPPKAHYAIEMGEYFIDVDEQLPAGDHIFQLTNAGEQGHEMLVMEEKTEEEVGFAFAPPPGSTSWIEMELEPGTYVFTCFFPDVKDDKLGRKNHNQLGMETTVTVE
jgi:hypothetical protein